MTAILVTEHALARVRQRYGLVNLDSALIRHDVADGLLSGRASKNKPGGESQAVRGNKLFVWTPNVERIYVIDVARCRGKRVLRVLTAIPGRYGADHRGARTEWAA